MAMTEGALLFMGVLATLATLGLFYQFPDRWTGVVVTFLAAVLWGFFGLSAFDVIVATTNTEPLVTLSEPITPLAYLGLGMAFIVGIYGFYDLITATGEEAREADVGLTP